MTGGEFWRWYRPFNEYMKKSLTYLEFVLEVQKNHFGCAAKGGAVCIVAATECGNIT